jgi:chromosome segregation ATPase
VSELLTEEQLAGLEQLGDARERQAAAEIRALRAERDALKAELAAYQEMLAVANNTIAQQAERLKKLAAARAEIERLNTHANLPRREESSRPDDYYSDGRGGFVRGTDPSDEVRSDPC